MKRVLLATFEYPPDTGGVGRYYVNLLNNLKDCECIVLTHNKNIASIDSDDHCTVLRTTLVTRWIWPHWIPLAYHMLKIVVTKKPQCVFVGNVLPVGSVALLLHWLLNIRYVVFVHGLDIMRSQAHARKAALSRRILSHAALVVTNSHATAQLVRQCNVPHTKIVVVHPGTTPQKMPVSPTAQRELLEQNKMVNAKIVLTVARLVPRKGVDISIQAFQKIAPSDANLHYVIIGEGSDMLRLQNLALLSSNNQIHFFGSISDAMLSLWISACTVFVLTPRSTEHSRDIEGYGIVYLEAGSFGKPVIGSTTGGVPEAVQGGVTGLLVLPDNIEETARAMQRILHDESLRNFLGRNGAHRALEECSWQTRASVLSHELTVRNIW